MCRSRPTRALEHYFSPGNLTALRELALRRTAQRVDEQTARPHAGPRHRRALGGRRARAGLRQRGRRARPGAGALCPPPGRAAARALDGAPRRDRRARLRLTEAERDRIADALRLAERLGGEAVTMPGRDDRRRHPRPMPASNNFTQIVVGKPGAVALVRSCCAASVAQRAGPPRRRHQRARRRPAPSRGGGAAETPRDAAARSTARLPIVAHHRDRRGGARRSGSRCSEVLGGRPTSRWCSSPRCWSSPPRFGLWPSLLACLVSVLAYNFFFLPPLYTFTIADPENVVALFFFLIAAVDRQQPRRAACAARRSPRAPRARTTEELYASAASSPASSTLDDLLWATAYQIASMLQGARGAAAAGGRGHRRCAPAIRRRTSSTRPTSPPPTGAGSTTAPAGRGADTLPGGAAAVPAAAHRPRPGRRHRHRRDDRSRARCSTPGPAPPARRAGRPGGGGDRADQPGRGRRPRPAAGRDRAAALGAADLDLARSAHAAGVHPGRGHQPARAYHALLDEAGAARAARAPSTTRPSGSTASSPTCST